MFRGKNRTENIKLKFVNSHLILVQSLGKINNKIAVGE